ncbi:CsbD family protein [Aquabacter sp. P-9]|uniref:CsbD family protein n=1 Tax=Aquabacter sediminis TaxID=3029197 RepID=UPI00237D5940|nr:CsbD family protein [Aquabacter sp. P-9]MDE1570812.1 CsbD family protein [Aquabacter sp. P-9]
MNWDRIEGNWKQFSGSVKTQWGKLTDDDMTQINGNREKLEGKLQERYGLAKDQVKEQVDTWYRGVDRM